MERGPTTRKLILFGVAIAIPLVAVAVYFAAFEQPAPRLSVSQAATTAAPGGAGETGQPALPPEHPPIGGQPEGGAGAPAGHPQMGGGRAVRVPDEVKAKWQAVKLQVERITGGKGPQVFTVRVGGSLDIPGSTLQITVRNFLPALQVSGNEVTTAGNEPTNPAALVTVSEGGKEIFKGWLFARFPNMQAFQHPVYRITLLEGVPKG